MSIAPYAIQCRRDGKWATVQSDELLPGDIVSIGMYIDWLSLLSQVTVVHSSPNYGDFHSCRPSHSQRSLYCE